MKDGETQPASLLLLISIVQQTPGDPEHDMLSWNESMPLNEKQI